MSKIGFPTRYGVFSALLGFALALIVAASPVSARTSAALLGAENAQSQSVKSGEIVVAKKDKKNKKFKKNNNKKKFKNKKDKKKFKKKGKKKKLKNKKKKKAFKKNKNKGFKKKKKN